ncbi:hypothetical protein [Nonomuraea sediminis]|uniref:hypothetical protein n=1 Tax=Nonomuraea sediminis TaxID=2835864 RepID=UPI001BDCDB02|nr:hypothetical protein [Nonomuraea sediminis]
MTTGMLTQRWGWAWLAATIVLVTVGAVSQVWLTLADRTDRTDRTGGAEPREGVTVTGDVSGIVSTGADATNIQINPPGA